MSSAKSARAPARKPAKAGAPAYRVRRSRVHGQGVFATRRIRKGTRVVEYLGERISHKEADRRYELKKEKIEALDIEEERTKKMKLLKEGNFSV